jgi:hypothetical protein
VKQTPQEFLLARLTASRDVSAALLLASKKTPGVDAIEILALRKRIIECSDPENNFVAKDAHNPDTGEAYDAVGNLWSCNSKLCPTCIATFSRRNRKRLRDAIAKQKLRKGERYHFATFTVPNIGLSLVATRAIVNRAWELFRKRKLCVDLVRGGSKSEEFTLTAKGYHYHLHCIFLSGWLSFQEVRRVWTECVGIAFSEANEPFEVRTSDGNLFVKILPVTDLKKAIFEVCKYVTKSDSWRKMKVEHIAEVALIKRWHRMFEVFGSFSERQKRKVKAEDADASGDILDTRNFTDGDKPSHSEFWREALWKLGFEGYIERLHDEIRRTREARMRQLELRWPQARIILADEFT